MTINRLNYELFLVDYLDGKLDPFLVAELLIFLEQNPDIKEEYDGIQNSVLEKEAITFPNKSILKKKSFSKNGIDDELAYLCISSVENLLSEEEQNLLNKKIYDDVSLKKELLLFDKTVTVADQSIIFKSKSRLKRTSIVPIRQSSYKVYVGVAASIALLIGMFTIGKIILTNNSINDIQENSFSIANYQPIKKNIESVDIKTMSRKEEGNTLKNSFSKTVNSEKAVAIELKDSAKIEMPIPEKIQRIELSELTTSNNWPETISSDILSKQTYPITLNKHLYASNDDIENGGHIKEIGVFEIIQYGVKSIGDFFGANLQLNAKKDKNGKVKEIHFESKLIAFTAPVGKNE